MMTGSRSELQNVCREGVRPTSLWFLQLPSCSVAGSQENKKEPEIRPCCFFFPDTDTFLSEGVVKFIDNNCDAFIKETMNRIGEKL